MIPRPTSNRPTSFSGGAVPGLQNYQGRPTPNRPTNFSGSASPEIVTYQGRPTPNQNSSTGLPGMGINGNLMQLNQQLQQAQQTGNVQAIGQLQGQVANMQNAASGNTMGSLSFGGVDYNYPMYGNNGQLTNQAIMGGVIGDYQGQYDEAKASNENRYNDILGGYNERYQRGVDSVRSYGEQQGADINEGFRNKGIAAQQNLKSRGLGNTTVTSAASTVNERERSSEQRRLGEDLTRMRTGLDAQLSGDALSFQERRTDEYPNFNQMSQMAQMMGMAGNNDGFGYMGGGGGGGLINGLTPEKVQQMEQQRQERANSSSAGSGKQKHVFLNEPSFAEKQRRVMDDPNSRIGLPFNASKPRGPNVQVGQSGAPVFLSGYNMPKAVNAGYVGYNDTNEKFASQAGLNLRNRKAQRADINARRRAGNQQGNAGNQFIQMLGALLGGP